MLDANLITILMMIIIYLFHSYLKNDILFYLNYAQYNLKFNK